MQRIELEDGAYLELYETWLAEPRLWFDALLGEIPWQAKAIRIFGREVMQPRLVAYLGEPEAVYTYSGVRNEPGPLGVRLSALRTRLEAELGLPFNAVLCNLYRNGLDSMGMHRDAEPELGPIPQVASISIGATRRFRLRHVASGRAGCDLERATGSLLLMRGTTQRFYRHGVAKQPSIREPRINLTFRNVLARAAATIAR